MRAPSREEIDGERSRDGRRRRGDENRSKIVRAMLALTRAGEMAPGAAQVAKKAGVGLRSVFRHFEDMEALYQEMSQIVTGKILPIIATPVVAKDWKSRLFEIAERRMGIYDDIMPFKVAGALKRFQSRFLMDDYKRHLRMERETLEALLPRRVLKDTSLVRAIEMVISFQAWRRLRQDQNLATAEARKVALLLLTRLVAGEA